jgi:hypothetical protein
MRPKRRLSVAEFEAIRPFIPMGEKRIEGARLALVDGQSLQGIATIYGCSRQAINDAVNIVLKQHLSFQKSQQLVANAGTLLPPGWEQVTLIAPSALIKRFRDEIAQAMPVIQEDAALEVLAKTKSARPAKGGDPLTVADDAMSDGKAALAKKVPAKKVPASKKAASQKSK